MPTHAQDTLAFWAQRLGAPVSQSCFWQPSRQSRMVGEADL